MKKRFLFALAIIASLYSCKEENNNLPDGLYAKIETSKDDITVKLELTNLLIIFM